MIQPLNGEPFRAKMLLDTGNGDDTFLNTPLVKEKKLLDTTRTAYFVAVGPAGEVYGRTGRLGSITLGDYVIDHLSVGMFQSMGGEAGTKDRDGGLGNTVLCRFDVVLDLSGHHLFLKPNADFTKPSPPIHYSGLYVKLVHDGYEITGIDAGSPAALAGLLPGDIVLAVDDVSITGGSQSAATTPVPDSAVHHYRIRRDGKEVILEMRYTFFRGCMALLPHK